MAHSILVTYTPQNSSAIGIKKLLRTERILKFVIFKAVLIKFPPPNRGQEGSAETETNSIDFTVL